MVFKLTNSYDDETHHFRVYEVASPDDDNWLQLLAEEYLRLLTDWDTFNTNIQRIKERNDSTLNLPTSGIMKYITELSIPERSDDNFDVVRSDFGEILGYTLLEREYRTLFGPKSICERELRDRPGRGIDTVGIEPGDPLTLILCEAKVSDETQSPPQVVDYKPDCLKKQHLQHIKNENKKTTAKIVRDATRSRDPEIFSLLFNASTLFQEQRWDLLRFIVCSVLIRPKSIHKITDFGSFKKKPEQYSPAKVRFLVVCIPDLTDVIINKWYSIVQKSEVSNE